MKCNHCGNRELSDFIRFHHEKEGTLINGEWHSLGIRDFAVIANVFCLHVWHWDGRQGIFPRWEYR